MIKHMEILDKTIPDKKSFTTVKGAMGIHQITWCKKEA